MSVRVHSSFSAAGICALAIVLVVLNTNPLHAQTFKVLFDGTASNTVINPSSRIVTQGRDGAMYFTSANGGTFYGTFFKVSSTGSEALLNDVSYYPNGGATLGTDGNYYVVNLDGGPGGNCGFSGCGQLLKITPAGTSTVLHNFTGLGDGSAPAASPIEASTGIFYGTTPTGGSSNASTVYTITSTGTFKTLHTFATSEGQNVYAELVQGTDGNFYGTAQNGGANGDGTIFKMTPSGTLTVIYNFDTSSNNPCCGLVQANDGNFYGTANGGANGSGVIFRVTPSGTYTIVYSLDSGNGDGTNSAATLTLGSDGKLYGATAQTNGGNPGTLFSVTTSGTYKPLYTFCQSGTCTDGVAPSTPLKQNTSGIFYGGAYDGGDLTCGNSVGCGVVYSLNLGLAPFAKLAMTSGKEGAKIGIFGQGFTTATTVSFGGTEATSVSHSGTNYITATVPADALTGTVTVTTGKTVLKTLQTFKVTPSITTFTPSSGPVATAVTITGTGLAQTTRVTFNNKQATFTVDSDTQVTATVPAGATTGKIAVTTKGGTVTSTTNFTVN